MSTRIPAQRPQHLLAGLLLLGLTQSLAAQTLDLANDPHGPRRFRGGAGSTSAETAAIDSISPFNGSLQLHIPIGQSYPAGGALSYALAAHYNSNVQDVRQRYGPHPDHEQNSEYPAYLPNAGSTAGLGWSLHLGRLFEPGDYEQYNGQTPQWRERRPKPAFAGQASNLPGHSGWRYFSAEDAASDFYTTIREEASAQPGVFYSRDGAYSRLQLLAPGASQPRLGSCPSGAGVLQCAYLELADGDVHRFEKRASWADSQYNPDVWRLREIRDRGDGSSGWNSVEISYHPGYWQVSDQYQRVQQVHWEADPTVNGAAGWYFGRVKEVRLSAFDNTTAIWRFNYQSRTFRRVNDQGSDHEARSVSVLASITRPDGRSYVVAPPAGDYSAPIQSAQLPNGGQLQWQYSQQSLPSVSQCRPDGASSTGGALQDFVKYRAVRDAGGTTLAENWYLWGQYAGTSLPAANPPHSGYCMNDSFWITPAAEHVGGLFQRYENGRARLTLNYFSVWPFPGYVSDDGASGSLWTPAMASSWGWKGEEFGQPFTRNQTDPATGSLLSSEIYDCALDSPGRLDELPDPRQLAATSACTRVRSTYLSREGIRLYPTPCPGGCTPAFTASVGLEPGDSGLAQTSRAVTVFHDNGNTRTVDEFSDNDGFGHHRVHRSSGTIGPDPQREHYSGLNLDRGTLRLGRNGAVSSESTWSVPPRDSGWVLGNSTQSAVRELDAGSWRTVFEQLACFQPHTALLNRLRVRKFPGADSREDLATVYTYNHSLPQRSRYYGGDLTPLPQASMGAGCGYGFESASTPLNFQHDYAYGVLLGSRQQGSSVYLLDHRDRSGQPGIDRNTGLVTAARDGSGTLLTETRYDLMSRPIRVTRSGGSSFSDPNVAADEEFTWFLPGDQAPVGWTGPVDRPFVRSRSFKGNLTVQQSTAIHDVLGREVRSETSHPESGMLRIERSYTPDGQLRFETSAQLTGVFSASRGTARSFDLFGRVLTLTAADGHVTRYSYSGAQRVDVQRQIGAVDSGTSVQTRGSISSSYFDRHGNLLRTTEPVSSTAPVSIAAICGDAFTTCKTTDYRYDALDRQIASVRGGQTRLRAYDGRGLLRYERLPELGGGSTPCTAPGAGCKMLSLYNTLGKAGRSSDGQNTLNYSYDSAGRLTEVRDTTALLLSNSYGDSGLSNGRLLSAERHNWVTRENAGGAGDYAGAPAIYGDRRVRYSFDYHPSGGMLSRQVQVHYVPPAGAEHLMAQFDQSWGYDSIGRVSSIAYPQCTRPGCVNTGTARTVQLAFGMGSRTVDISTADHLGATLAYHDNGQLERITHHGPAGRTDWLGMGPAYSARLGSLNLASPSSSSPLQAGYLNLGTHQYDGAGNVIQVGATRFVMDLDSRLVKSYLAGFWGSSQSFGYDQYDNMTAATPDTFQFDAATNRFQGADMGYNPAGQLTRVGGFGLHYDALAQQQSMVLNSSGAANPCQLDNITGSCWLYWYGPDGERIGGIALLPGGASHYYWTVRDRDGRVLRRFDGINEGITPREDMVYAGRLLIGSRNFTSGAARHHHSDHLATVRLSVDAGTGALVGQRSFSPYGRTITDSAGLLTSSWAGYEIDPNAMTHNLKARQYFSTWGRFFTPDPARDGWNLYAYARNNPVSNVDPNGLSACRDRGQEANGTAAATNHVVCVAEVKTGPKGNLTPNQAAAQAILNSGGRLEVRSNKGPFKRGDTISGDYIHIYVDDSVLELRPSIANGSNNTRGKAGERAANNVVKRSSGAQTTTQIALRLPASAGGGLTYADIIVSSAASGPGITDVHVPGGSRLAKSAAKFVPLVGVGIAVNQLRNGQISEGLISLGGELPVVGWAFDAGDVLGAAVQTETFINFLADQM